jgi:tRNA-specific 2-thiouridylase
LLTERIIVKDINWLGPVVHPDQGLGVEIKIRSASSPAPAQVYLDGNGGAVVVPEMPESGVAPGQACVFYDGTRVLGGGWIVRKEAA